jgi:hypothetical protein
LRSIASEINSIFFAIPEDIKKSRIKSIDVIQEANKETGLNRSIRSAQRTTEKLKHMDIHADGGATPSA